MTRNPSIRRQLRIFVLGALCIGAPILALAAYWLMLTEVDEVMNDSLQQTALLLADKDLRGAIADGVAAVALPSSDTESKLVAVARQRDGTLLFTSEPEMMLGFAPTAGLSVQEVDAAVWHVYTVVQSDRIVQVAQPAAVRRDMAIESASQLLIPLVVMVVVMAVLLFGALRHGLKPLEAAEQALARRGIDSLEPLSLDGVPRELLPVAETLNDLLRRLELAVRRQREFIADAAHELRSPVTALRLQAQVLARSDEATERGQAAAELEAGVARMSRLIEQLLALSRTSGDGEAAGAAAAARDIDVGELARDAVARWTPAAERRGIDLGAVTASDVRTRGDPTQLEMALNNLVENALRYTPRGGTVDVCARLDGGVPIMAVADDGPGIAPAERERIFDRFYRSAEAIASGEPGSGLGLAIVRAIAERHGADVTLQAGIAGKGVEVRVAFRRVS
ncbi:MAG TPA: ATP-binding protein [Burkholderiaceae bacterium]|nr:ATP-binding protein [Burkholderiaceae bacterium]